MCRTVHAVLSTAICGVQMLVRVFMTIVLMLENLIRMVLQTFYNFISFLLQMISLLPICCVFLISSRLKCFMCGGGGPCPVNRGGACDCLMSGLAILILFFIFRATGVLDKIFYSMGYAKAQVQVARFIPTPGDITECSRNDTEITEYELEDYNTTPLNDLLNKLDEGPSTNDTEKLNAQTDNPNELSDDLQNNATVTLEPTITFQDADGTQGGFDTDSQTDQGDSNDNPNNGPGLMKRARLTTTSSLLQKTTSSLLISKIGKMTKTTVFYYLV